MFHENDEKVKKSTSVCSDGSSCQFLFANSARMKKPGSHLHWLDILLLFALFAGQASCNGTSAAPSTLSITTTNAQTSVHFLVKVTVDFSGQQNESQITAWLNQVFQNNLQSCLLSPTPTSPQTTSSSTSNETTLVMTATTTLQSNNTTTAAATTLQSNNTTTAAATPTSESNNTTTALATTLQSNNSTTAAATPTSGSNNTTTAAATPTSESNNTTTASATPTSEGNNTTTAAANPTSESNNTTAVSATTTLESNNTTTAAATPTSESNNTTAVSATTTLESNNTTRVSATPTSEGNNTTTASATPTSQSNNPTTASATPRSEGNNPTKVAATPTSQGNNPTTASANPTSQRNNPTTVSATPMSEGNNPTAASANPISQSNNPTAASTTPTSEGNNPTKVAATPTSQGNNPTTFSANPTSQTNNPTIASATPTSEGNNPTTASANPISQGNNPTAASATPTSEGNNPTKVAATPTSQGNNPTTFSANPTSQSNNPTAASATPTSESNKPAAETNPKPENNNKPAVAATPKPENNNKPTTAATPVLQSIGKRIARNSVRETSAIRNDISTGLFQEINVSCTPTTGTRNTNCSVMLQLKQSVPSCCILRTLCAASKTSSDIRVVGKTADLQNPLQNQCNNTRPEENSCIYTGQAGASCDKSESAYVQRNSTYCGADKENNNCNCSAYCSRPDAYYTFQISIQDSNINDSYILSVISKVNQPTNCPSSGGVSCSLPIIASEFQDAILECGITETNLQRCEVILRFGHEVPICNVSAALIHVLQSERGILYNGLVTRVAICGNSEVSDNPLNSEFVWLMVQVKPAAFCTTRIGFGNQTCPKGLNAVLLMKEQCVGVFTTPSPNVTTAQPNTTTVSANVTSSPLNTTVQAPNATTTAANITASDESQANALLELTRNVSRLNSSQVNQLVSQLEKLLSGPSVSLALGNTSVAIVSNLLGASPEVLSASSNRIIGIVDTVGLKLVLNGRTNTLLSPDVSLSVKPVDGSNFKETIFSILNPTDVQVSGGPKLRRSVRTNPSIPQGSITLPSSLTQNLTAEQQRLASRVQFTFYQESTVFQDKSLGKRKLNSGILGATVANLSITKLQDNVIVQLRNTEPIPANFVATCVFWDFILNDGSGGWNSKGCFVKNSTDNETICGCNHLTSFAILLDLSKEPVTSRLQNTILTFITYIGCGLSAIFLSITLLTYLAFEKLQKDIPSKILIQLCLALLLLNLVFLLDSWLALYPDAVGLCISTAWFLHYFLLVTFTWMGLEAVHMYLAIVKVFNRYISHYMLKFSLVGWGVPMIVVIIVIAINKNNYGLVSYGRFSDGSSDEFCWLKNDIAFYVAVVAYFCIIFLFNLVMFVVVLVQLCRIKRQNPQHLQHRTTMQDLRSVGGITVLLGLTWGFAFFAWGPLNLPFMYLFTIFNSLQGFFIFVFYCAVKENVRKQWRTYLCCGKMRLAENSEWSRTATQKTMKKSSVTKQRSHHSSSSSQSNNLSSSSFLVNDSSEPFNGIGNPSGDRAITADEDR